MDLASPRLQVEDTPEALYDLFEAEGVGDGLPFVPPTAARVTRFVEASGRPAQEPVGRIPPSWQTATVERVAVNAVMAGCRPEYMPVVLAAVEAVADPAFNLYGVQATTHMVAPLVIVNGPVRAALGLNAGHNAFGQGFRANATIGRALRLVLQNVGVARPGAGDMATLGSPAKYTFCIAEREEASPWEPLHVARGCPPGSSAVTVVGCESPHNVNDHVSQSAVNLLTTVADSMATMGQNPTYTLGRGEVLVVFGPEHAETLRRDGFSRADVRRFLYENARKPVRKLRLGGMWGMFPPPAWVNTLDDDAMLPIVATPEDILLAVAGGAGKHSVYLPSFGITRAVTRQVR
jgi:hypothetical protein